MYCARMPGGAICPDADKCRATLQSVLDACEAPLRDDAIRRLKRFKEASSLFRQAMVNFRAERMLACRFWRGFVEAVGGAREDPIDICRTIRAYMRSVRFGGPTAFVPDSAILGRATTRQELAAHFVRNRYFPTKLDAELSIDEVMRIPIDEGRRKWDRYALGQYVMWSTFRRTGGRPFEHTRSAKMLRAILGLSRRAKSRPMLILEYLLPAGHRAYLPTVAEAYAGDPWLPYFRPVDEDDEKGGHGLTQAWDEKAQHAGLPEVVHEPVQGRALEYPPEEIR